MRTSPRAIQGLRSAGSRGQPAHGRHCEEDSAGSPGAMPAARAGWVASSYPPRTCCTGRTRGRTARSLDPRGRRRALDAAHHARRVPRRPPVRRHPARPRHRAQRAARPPLPPRRRGPAGAPAYQERPPRSEYRLTAKGRDLWPVLHALLRFGDRWYARTARRGGSSTASAAARPTTADLHEVRRAAGPAGRARGPAGRLTTPARRRLIARALARGGPVPAHLRRAARRGRHAHAHLGLLGPALRRDLQARPRRPRLVFVYDDARQRPRRRQPRHAA